MILKRRGKKKREDESSSNKITKLHKPAICAANVFYYFCHFRFPGCPSAFVDYFLFHFLETVYSVKPECE